MDHRTVLLVENDPLELKLLRSILRLGGYQVLEASDAETGLERAAEHLPDLVLMDLRLPDSEGLEATRRLKGDPRLAQIPVIALVPRTDAGTAERALEAGCLTHLPTPVDTRTFLPTLARYFKGDQRAPSEPQRVQIPEGKKRVLIVDDEAINLKLLAAKLPGDQFEIHTADGGIEALEQVAACRPDIILLDILMPDIDGIEVTRILRTDARYANIPVLLITALNGLDDKVEGLEAGADDFLNKPVNTGELLARVKSLIKLSRYREQLEIRRQAGQPFVVPGGGAAARDQEANGPRVLIIDPHQGDAARLESLIHEGQVHLAHSGRQALEVAAAELLDLIVLELDLPDIKGLDLCHRLKTADRTRHCQLFVVTRREDRETRIASFEAGADDYLIKPVHGAELVSRARSLLRKKRYLDRLVHHLRAAYASSMTDSLTGLYNHAYFHHFFPLELHRARRQDYPVSLLMIDLDDFKEINDRHGHRMGDQLLEQCGRLLRSTTRHEDFVARYGGDEFVVVLPYADMEGARRGAERIRGILESHEFSLRDGQVPLWITVSIGMSSCPRHGSSVEELLEKADNAMYRAKGRGKNRVCVHITGEHQGVANGGPEG
jgi:two-component system cell cycle response regulator